MPIASPEGINNNQGVAFMITFRLIIKYMYLKTEECQDVTNNDERIYSDSDAIENIVEKSMVVAF
jgi:hypothetical protein